MCWLKDVSDHGPTSLDPWHKAGARSRPRSRFDHVWAGWVA
jgi:hypothetical protein